MSQRAVSLKEYLLKEQAATGKNLRDIVDPIARDRMVKNGSWEAILDAYDRDYEDTGLGPKGADCSTMATYVDDCKLDAEKRRKRAVWTVVKLMFEGSEDSEGGGYLGVHDAGPGEHGKDYVTTMSQVEYVQHMLAE